MRVMADKISMAMPDDMHLHLRDGPETAFILQHTLRRFARAIVMPNLQPPVITARQALDYQERIFSLFPAGARFQPLMTLFLSEHTPLREVAAVAASRNIWAFKYYPAGATTHAESGVTAVEKVYPLLEEMQKHDVPLLVHGEVTEEDVDVFDREAAFIERVLSGLTRRFPELRIVFEHITTADAVDFARAASDKVAATITPQHLLLNRNAMFDGGLRPHRYCLPLLKSERHRQALLAAATGGEPRFFLGTDSAPHSVAAKQDACGCAGVYSAFAAMEIYAAVFDQAGCLPRLEGFAARHGADFYGLPRNTGRLELTREDWRVPDLLQYPDGGLAPLLAGEICPWRLTATDGVA